MFYERKGAVVYWIEPLTLDQRVAGSIPVNAWPLFVLQQDTLSTLLLSTQVYKWVPGRMRTSFCCMMWLVCAPEVASGQNAPQGVVKVHYECRIDIESSDQGNTL